MQYVLLIYQGTTPLPTDPEAWATLSAMAPPLTRGWDARGEVDGVEVVGVRQRRAFHQ